MPAETGVMAPAGARRFSAGDRGIAGKPGGGGLWFRIGAGFRGGRLGAIALGGKAALRAAEGGALEGVEAADRARNEGFVVSYCGLGRDGGGNS